MPNDQSIEQEIQAKGLTAARVTPADIEAAIASEHYFTAWHGLCGAVAQGELHQRHPAAAHSVFDALSRVTICALVLRNGTKVIGVNEGPVSAGNFDADLGRKLSRSKAIDQIWPMLGYELRSKLSAPQA